MNMHRKTRVVNQETREKKNICWETHWVEGSSSFVVYKVLVKDKNLIVNPLSDGCKESLILYETFVCES